MRRRTAIRALVSLPAFFEAGCEDTARLCQEFAHFLNQEHLAILWADSIDATKAPAYFANRLASGETGQTSVSPDGRSVAWIPEAHGLESRGRNSIFVAALNRPVRSLEVSRDNIIDFAAADYCQVIVAVTDRRLLLFDASGGPEADLTSNIEDLSMRDVRKVSVSGAGDYVAISTQRQFLVLGLPDGKRIFAGPGSYASVSPAGDQLAFVDQSFGIRLIRPGRIGTTRSLHFEHPLGLAVWSPRGDYLLASAFVGVPARKQLIIVANSTLTFCALARLREGDDGSRLALIRRDLVVG
jgi:hypothetical protein